MPWRRVTYSIMIYWPRSRAGEQALKRSLQSSVMPQFSIFDPRERPFDRPACPKCECPMWLASIEPDKPDHDKRRHECPRCQYEEETVVRYR